LRIFIVDLKTGTLVRKIDTGIEKAFAGSMAENALDSDKGKKNSLGFYSTDVVYIGYVKPDTTGSAWIDGGLLRLVTKDDVDPNSWEISTVIDDTGPVTASIEKMYDDRDSLSGKPELWLYFGSGRYFFKNNSAGIDSSDDVMAIYGIKEPCYSVTKVGDSWTKDYSMDMNPACTRSLTKGSLTDQSSDTPNDNLVTGKTDGWYINLDASNAAYKAERCISTPSVKTNGLLQFSTFKPTADICGFGGETFFWLLDYKTGGPPPCGSLTGKITIQLSTGAIVVVDLYDVLCAKGIDHRPPRPPGGGHPPYTLTRGGRQIDVGSGKPPGPAPPADSLKKPVKKVLQIQER
jgi:type IV pilus assembly protein PilY1